MWNMVLGSSIASWKVLVCIGCLVRKVFIRDVGVGSMVKEFWFLVGGLCNGGNREFGRSNQLGRRDFLRVLVGERRNL